MSAPISSTAVRLGALAALVFAMALVVSSLIAIEPVPPCSTFDRSAALAYPVFLYIGVTGPLALLAVGC